MIHSYAVHLVSTRFTICNTVPCYAVQEMLHSQQLLFWQHHRNNGLAASTEAQGDTDTS